MWLETSHSLWLPSSFAGSPTPPLPQSRLFWSNSCLVLIHSTAPSRDHLLLPAWLQDPRPLNFYKTAYISVSAHTPGTSLVDSASSILKEPIIQNTAPTADSLSLQSTELLSSWLQILSLASKLCWETISVPSHAAALGSPAGSFRSGSAERPQGLRPH